MTPSEFRQEFDATMEMTKHNNESFTVTAISALAMAMLAIYGYLHWSMLLLLPAVLAILVIWRFVVLRETLHERAAATMLRKYARKWVEVPFSPGAFAEALEVSPGYTRLTDAQERMEYRAIMARFIARSLLNIELEPTPEQREFWERYLDGVARM